MALSKSTRHRLHLTPARVKHIGPGYRDTLAQILGVPETEQGISGEHRLVQICGGAFANSRWASFQVVRVFGRLLVDRRNIFKSLLCVAGLEASSSVWAEEQKKEAIVVASGNDRANSTLTIANCKLSGRDTVPHSPRQLSSKGSVLTAFQPAGTMEEFFHELAQLVKTGGMSPAKWRHYSKRIRWRSSALWGASIAHQHDEEITSGSDLAIGPRLIA
jgi:hypothetical protein